MTDEVRTKISDAKSAIVKAIADLHLMEKKAEQIAQKAEKLREKALLALKENREDIAREILRRKQELLEMKEEYVRQIAEHRIVVDDLKRGLRQLESKARAVEFKTADVKLKISSVFSDYERIVDRIEQLEAEL